MTDLHNLLSNLTPEIYASLKRAIELGKWADGKALDSEQKSLCMQAVIAYEHRHLPPEQHTGYIAPKAHTPCASANTSDEAPLKWQ